jgi:hypothetical protein
MKTAQQPRHLTAITDCPQPSPSTAWPSRWPRKPAEALWAWMARSRPPLPILVLGAEGGVGTSTTCALIAETVAAASPGPTVLLNQSGHTGNTAIRRLVAQQAGLDGHRAVSALRQGTPATQVLRSTPTSSAGAHLVDDGPGYTNLRGLLDLVRVICGGLVIDGGRVDLATLPRLNDARAVMVLIGRADVAGAEAVCAALRFLHQRPTPIHPIVVLSSTTSTRRTTVRAALKLVGSVTPGRPNHLPFDTSLTTSAALRLDQIGKPIVRATLDITTQVGHLHEAGGHGR